MNILRIKIIPVFGALWVCMSSAMADGGFNPSDLGPEHWLMLLGTVGFAVAGIFLFNAFIFLFVAVHIALLILLIIRIIWKIEYRGICRSLFVVLALFYIFIAGVYLKSHNG